MINVDIISVVYKKCIFWRIFQSTITTLLADQNNRICFRSESFKECFRYKLNALDYVNKSKLMVACNLRFWVNLITGESMRFLCNNLLLSFWYAIDESLNYDWGLKRNKVVLEIMFFLITRLRISVLKNKWKRLASNRTVIMLLF